MNNESSVESITIWNKFQAFIIAPTIMSLVSGVLYLIYSVGDIHGQSVLAVIATPFLYCIIYQPIFENDEFKNVYLTDGGLSFKKKLIKHKGTLIKYYIMTAVTAFFAITMH